MAIDVGTPITTEQAVRAVLRMIRSSLLGDIDQPPRGTQSALFRARALFPMLSSGEQKLVDIAWSIWRGPQSDGAHISALGGLDRDTRRKVLLVLVYFYLGRDVRIELDHSEFTATFGDD